MPVIGTVKDVEALTLTIVSELAADPERVWQVWQDPRKLERWWGPPEWPATFYEHDFSEGGRSRYHGSTATAGTLESTATGTRMTLLSQFESVQQLEEMLAMGMEEGMTQALGQVDAILAG